MNTIKVALACFIGSALGIFSMLESNPKFWPIGLVVGGIAGYLSYEFKKVLTAVPIAWRYATNWRVDWKTWKHGFYGFLVCFSLGITVILPFVSLFLIKPQNGNLNGFAGLAIYWFLISAMGGCLFAREWCESPVRYHRTIHQCWNCNPIRVYLYLLPKWLARHVPSGVRLLVTFGWQLFKLIHSEERLLCGVDAAIGVAVCHYSGNNILLGIGVGVLWGVLNFEILSIRVLKLVPATASIFHRS